MYTFLLNFHSGFRYIVLLLLMVALLRAMIAFFGKKTYLESTRKINLFAMVATHTQFLVGLVLYFYSPFVRLRAMGEVMKDSSLRYWTVEHFGMMLFAVLLITVGHSRSKKAIEAMDKHRAIAIFYGLSLLTIMLSIIQSGRHL